jgi:hypothetical protein
MLSSSVSPATKPGAELHSGTLIVQIFFVYYAAGDQNDAPQERR